MPADKIAVVGDPPVKGMTFDKPLTTLAFERFLIIYCLPDVAVDKSMVVVEPVPVITKDTLFEENEIVAPVVVEKKV